LIVLEMRIVRIRIIFNRVLYSELQNDRRVFRKTGRFFFVYIVTHKQMFLSPRATQLNALRGLPSHGTVGRHPGLISVQFCIQTSLFICHGVNKRKPSCFFKNTSIVLQLAGMWSSSDIINHPGDFIDVSEPSSSACACGAGIHRRIFGGRLGICNRPPVVSKRMDSKEEVG
jgi:hypothetical protein